ncbi:MAG: serine/threonine protein kinase, partial [Planctomycetota bacterium]
MSFEKILQIDDLTLYHALKELQILSEEELDRAILLCQEKNRNLATLLVDLGKIHSQEVPQILDHIQNPDNIKKSPSFQTLTHNPLALIGKNLGKYEVLRLIAQGGMGLVYEGLDPVLERRVALKILSPILSRDPEYRHRFLREARLLAKIHHPHVVGIYDFGETDSNLFIAFQFVEGRSLEEITREEKIPLPTLLKYIRQIAEGLQEAHNHGIIHRDVKPANILINPNGQAVLTDFGIAHVDDSDLTSSGKNLGTPLYMAPETLEGKPVDARSDIYSLGVTLYYGLTGV